MFYRDALRELNSWSERAPRKPLVLRGARQVGKTTLVKYFARNFERFISLNLEKPEHTALFETGYSFKDMLDAIFFASNQKNDQKKTILFIDEIQNSPKAVASLRYFYEEAPQIYVIAAGSLLESLIDTSISFPVGRVEYLAVGPCSFHEFLGAINETQALEMLSQLPTPAFAHEKLSQLFHRFTLVGGMPEIVANYAQHGDLVRLNTIYQSLLAGYTDDVEKYAQNSSMLQQIRHILKTGFSYAGQRIKFEHFGSSNYRSREMGEAFRTLEKAMLLEMIYPTTNYTLPLLADYKKSPRLQWLDTGLVNYAAGIQHDVFNNPDISNAWRGIIAEHIVGQEIIAQNTNVLATRNFWVREAKNSNAEIDFVLQFGGLLIPVEVKSNVGSALKSLHLFAEQAPHNFAIRFWSKPFSIDEIKTHNGKIFRLINLPFYLSSDLQQVLQKYI